MIIISPGTVIKQKQDDPPNNNTPKKYYCSCDKVNADVIDDDTIRKHVDNIQYLLLQT